MTVKVWGHLNCPNDPLTLLEYLETYKDKKQITLCELGVATGRTGNRMVEFLKQINVEKIQYYGVDNLHLDAFNKVENAKPDFEFEEMQFVQGDRKELAKLPKVDFGFVDACHCAECVFHDSIAMSKIVKKGGAMAFHDTSLLWQYPNGESQPKQYWQHLENGVLIRPMGVVEGIMMSRAKWHGEWNLIRQTGDDLLWGGIRIYEKTA